MLTPLLLSTLLGAVSPEPPQAEGVAFQARFTDVWAQREGRWQLVAIQRTDIAK